jgi:RNA 3'-terminal phosphate cyclase (ATP)
MLVIDGSKGEGGGQIIRSALALATVTNQPFEAKNIRAGRRSPGLMRQHLAALRAAERISQAEVAGASIGSASFRFRPGKVAGGDYEFRVGSAGSATLVLQTVLPALLLAERPSTVVLEGGTHNPWAPPFDFLAKAYLPLVQRQGPAVAATLERPGFFPAGGGRFVAAVRPCGGLRSFALLRRGEVVDRTVRAIVARLPAHIARRECQWIADQSDWAPSCFHVEQSSESRGPGNVVLIELECEQVTEVFTGFGAKGVPAEQVAEDVWQAARNYLRAGVPVGPFLADQLMLPLGLSAHLGGGDGAFRTTELSQHSLTHAEVLRQFLEVEVQVERESADVRLVRVSRRA